MKKLILFTGIILFITTLMFTSGFSQWPKFLRGSDGPAPANDTIPSAKSSDHTEGVLLQDDPWQEMEKLYAANNYNEGKSIKGTIRMVDVNGPEEKTIEEQEFEFEGFSSKYRYRIANLEVVNTDKINIIADHAGKLLSISPASKKSGTPQPFDIAVFRKIMVEQEAEASVLALGDQRILAVYRISDPMIQGYRIYYSAKDNRISKILIGGSRLSPLTEEPVMPGADKNAEQGLVQYTYHAVMTYDKVAPLAATLKQFKPEARFVSVNKKKLTLTDAFKNYQLISSLEH